MVSVADGISRRGLCCGHTPEGLDPDSLVRSLSMLSLKQNCHDLKLSEPDLTE